MIKAIIFDIGGVIISPANAPFKKRLSEASGIPVGKIVESILPTIALFESAKITEAQFLRRMGRRLGIAASSIDWLEPLRNARVDKVALGLPAKAHKRYITAYLSNVDKSRYKLAVRIIAGAPFDFKFASCYLGMVKPSKSIYRYALLKMKLRPEEVVFIDDMEENVRAASKLGIKAIRFTSVNALKKDLKRLGVKL